jgi:hypothetical protein
MSLSRNSTNIDSAQLFILREESWRERAKIYFLMMESQKQKVFEYVQTNGTACLKDPSGELKFAYIVPSG